MSYCYTYYIGYLADDGKVYPLGPYNYFGDLCPILSRSGSFASDLYESFKRIEKSAASDKLKAEFPYEFETENDSKYTSIKMFEVDKLPTDSFVKSGYFLIEDVKRYENGDWFANDGLFDESITPAVYANMLKNELILGAKLEVIDLFNEDEEEEPIPQYTAGDYMYYAFPDFYSREYEAHLLRSAAESFEMKGTEKLVILLVEG